MTDNSDISKIIPNNTYSGDIDASLTQLNTIGNMLVRTLECKCWRLGISPQGLLVCACFSFCTSPVEHASAGARGWLPHSVFSHSCLVCRVLPCDLCVWETSGIFWLHPQMLSSLIFYKTILLAFLRGPVAVTFSSGLALFCSYISWIQRGKKYSFYFFNKLFYLITFSCLFRSILEEIQ